MVKLFCAALGGAFGAVLRYVVSGLVYRYSLGVFPWGTLVVNLAGSIIISFLWGVFEIGVLSQNMRLFLFVGILGAFTTFSTFSFECFSLVRDGQYGFLIVNILLSVILGIVLVFGGYFSARFIINILR